MHIAELIERAAPVPWTGCTKIPWDDPAFSARMLREHLSQEHDRASRRSEAVDRQVAWIHETVLHGTPGRVLDLGCGPGLYTSRLARLGHVCTGIDFSPASIEHARAEAHREGLDCTYVLQDLRTTRLETSFQAILMLAGEFNTFAPHDARDILATARRHLDDAGALVLEVHAESFVRALGERPPGWFTTPRSVFTDSPHLCLCESSWHPAARATIERWFVLEQGSDRFTVFTSTTHTCSEDEYAAELSAAGFQTTRRFPDTDEPASSDGLFIIVARG